MDADNGGAGDEERRDGRREGVRKKRKTAGKCESRKGECSKITQPGQQTPLLQSPSCDIVII